MADNPLLKRLLDAGMHFTEMSQEQAEKVVKELVKSGQARRKDSEKLVQQLVERGRSTTEQVVSSVQSELSKQLGRFASQLDEIEGRVEEIARSVGIASKAAAKKVAPAKKAPAAKKAAPAKKAPAAKKAAPAKKAPAAKKAAPAKKAPAAKKAAPAQKAAAEQA
jgi:polyhydroxyalkanoate synthesis regulator phasin